MASRSISSRGPTTTFVVERYWPGVTDEAFAASAAAAREAARSMTTEGKSLRFVDAILVLGEQVVLTVFEADTPATVRDATGRVGLPFDRITEVARWSRTRSHPSTTTGGAGS